MLSLLLSTALANPSLAAGVGLAQSTGLPIVGLDLAWHPAFEGTSLYGRLAPAWGGEWVYTELPSGRQRLDGLAARGPFVLRNALGFTHVVPLDKQPMDVRVGLELGGELLAGADTAPIGPGAWGYTPRVLAVGELVRSDRSDAAVGLRAGVGSVPVATCDPSLSIDCIDWLPGFSGGIYAYAWLGHKVQLEIEISRASWFTVGYRF